MYIVFFSISIKLFDHGKAYTQAPDIQLYWMTHALWSQEGLYMYNLNPSTYLDQGLALTWLLLSPLN